MKLTFGDFSLKLRQSDAHVTALTLEDQTLLSLPREQPVFSLVALDESNRRIALVPVDGREDGQSLVFDRMQAADGLYDIHTRLSFAEKRGAAEFTVHVKNGDRIF